MSLSYPLILPASPPGFRNFDMLGRAVVGMGRSPSTGSQQTYEFPGSWWEIQAALPPMVRADAERWISFLLSLRGVGRTFLAGDPVGRAVQGTAGGSPIVNGSGQKGYQLAISGLTGVLKAGDYFHIGSAGENLLLWSQAFTNAVWTLGNTGASNPTVTDNAIVAPDGTTTAATIAYPSTIGGGNYSQILQVNASGVPVLAAGQSFMLSIWLKLASGTGTLQLYNADGVGSGAPANPLTANITASWQRFSVTGTYVAASGGPGILLRANNQAAITAHVWGANLERGLALNNYIPTTSTRATATRQLLKNLTDAGPGSVTLDISPTLRTSPLNGDPLVLSNSVGIFRLGANDAAHWTVDVAKKYGLGFMAVEAF